MKGLLVLRPEPGASATVERARQAGLNAVAIPLFEIEPVQWLAPEPGGFDGLLITSANAIRAAGEQLRELRGLKVYAVGDATAEVARAAGFDIVAVGESGVDRLLSSIDATLKLLHLCGENRRQPSDAPQEITAISVYRSKSIDRPDLTGASGTVALIHSPRAGRRFAELVNDRGSIAVVAISPQAAEAVGAGWETLETAAQPTDDALLALAARLCNKPDPK
jgi:uroporphyrinogen-III synthase